LGLVTIFTDVYFGMAGKLFDPVSGKNHRSGLCRSTEEVR
jgi:hypothetical protein